VLTVATDDWRALHVGGHDSIAGLAEDATRRSLYVAGWDGSAAADGCGADLGNVSTFTILRASAADPVDRLLYLTSNQWQEVDVAGSGAAITLTPRAPTGWINLTGI